jgi:hypothetical protein
MYLLPPLIILMMEAASFSEMSVNFYQATWHYNPEYLSGFMCQNMIKEGYSSVYELQASNPCPHLNFPYATIKNE